MGILSHLINGFAVILGFKPLAVIFVGVIIGIFVGVIPGLSPAMGVALLVPFSYGLDPLTALILLVSVYASANYGGTITAIAINTPGTPSAIVASFDGFPLTTRGEANRALFVSLVAATFGGMLGTLVLILFSLPLAKVALAFGPAEYFALAIFGLTIISSLSTGNWKKSLVATFIGLFLNTVGMDPFTGYQRFTFGVPELSDGLGFIPALIGLFALGEIFFLIEKGIAEHVDVRAIVSKLPGIRELKKLIGTIVRSSIIGTIIGVVPGAGATIAAFIAYSQEKRFSKHPEKFGKGAIEGVAAGAAAASGSVGGALVPLLTLGVPGSAATAVLIGALMLHGLNPGPLLFVKKAHIINGLFAALVMAYFFMFFIGFAGNKLWLKIIKLPRALLYPIVIAIAFIGSYAVSNSMFDVWSCLGFGLLGWLLKRFGYPTAPVILALILGSMAESNFRRALLVGNWTIFFTRPGSLIMLALALLSFIAPIIRARRAAKANEG